MNRVILEEQAMVSHGVDPVTSSHPPNPRSALQVTYYHRLCGLVSMHIDVISLLYDKDIRAELTVENLERVDTVKNV